MTELQTAYQRLRDAGCHHGEAIEKLALQVRLDRHTVERALSRAKRDEDKKGAYVRFASA